MEGKKRKLSSILKQTYNDKNDKNDNSSDDDRGDKVYTFQVLLPSGISVTLVRANPVKKFISLEGFVGILRDKSGVILKNTEGCSSSDVGSRREVFWGSKDLFLEDRMGNKIRDKVVYSRFKANETNILRLHDGAGQSVDSIENMWDLTPDTDLLTELPDDYTFETALADLIDNALQAVWSNRRGERKLISVEIEHDRVCIFDTGPGMDDSTENSIAKWGKMGASLHRSSKKLAIGGKPPFLTPFFGMFGYGGTIASMHLGRHAEVSSKTKESKTVIWLRLDRDALLKRGGSALNWKAPGGIREPSDDEIEKATHGSFLKVEMVPKLKVPDIYQLRCKLKDIYFPYIQYDPIAGGTKTLVEFQVNGLNLAEIEGGEVAITNLHSCNGPEFTLDVQFFIEEDKSTAKCQRMREANARLKCVYFPIIEGKENFDRVLEKLKADGCRINEDYQTFSRISIRRLGRLLPDARWELLPFMRAKQKRGDKLLILRRCCSRVKCFIDTDAGFNPIPSKTDLALHHPFTKALKELGSEPFHKDKEVKVKIFRDGKQLTLSQLERDYQNWILQMHNYDEEFDCGEDEPVLLVNVSNREALGVTSDVVRVHQAISRKGRSWKRGQKIKILKGACPGCHKTNIYATLEYFLLEGLQGDSGGEARVICRPREVQDEDSCELNVNAPIPNLELRGSMSLPIIVIDSGKCVALSDDEWNCQVEKLNLKLPSTIEVLGLRQCKALDIDGALPAGDTVSAGSVPPKEIVAVLRPSNFVTSHGALDLDQKNIIKDSSEMCMDVAFKAAVAKSSKVDHLFSATVTNKSRKGCQGLYIFSLSSISSLFQKAGVYSFSFSHEKSAITGYEISVHVKASSKIKRCELLKDKCNLPFYVSAGSCFPPFSVACYDEYDNCVPLHSMPEITFKLVSGKVEITNINKVKVEVSADKSHMIIKNLRITTDKLDELRPSYEATLVLSRQKLPILSIPCRVVPGPLLFVTVHKSDFGDGLLPKQVVEDFKFEMFDNYDNHVKEGTEVELAVHGLCIQDQIGLKRKVDNCGFVDLSGLLKVTGAYGNPVSLSVLSNGEVILVKKFQVQKRELRMATVVPEVCCPGSKLKDMAFEVVNSQGDVDHNIHDDDKHGQQHFLKLRTDSPDIDDSLKYAFRKGRCVIPSIALPKREGKFRIEAIHYQHPELIVKFQVTVLRVADAEYDISSNSQASQEHGDFISQSSDDSISPISVSIATKDVPRRKGSVMQDVQVPALQPKKECDFVSSFHSPNAMKTSECSDGKSMLHPDSSAFKNVATPMEAESQKKQATPGHTPDRQYYLNYKHDIHMFKSPESCTPKQAMTLLGIDFRRLENVEQAMRDLGSQIKDHEDNLKYFEMRKLNLEENLFDLQGSMEAVPLSVSGCMSQEVVLGNIENKVESAAAVYSIVSRDMTITDRHPFMDDLVGLVALLGAAPTHELSCSLAQYLGDDQMLAIVCKSNAAVKAPEEYEIVLNSLAAESGKCLKGTQLLICLEDIRAYAGGVIEGDSQKRLVLPEPVLPDGRTPPGYLGYAVNLVDINAKHLEVKTLAGHGLRETLFYRLFGKLQVYETREDMKQAYNCGYARDGAVSLDRGSMRGNGILSLGCKQLDVQFPVIADQKQLVVTSATTDDMEQIHKEEQIEKCRRELGVTVKAISVLEKKRSECMIEFKKKQAECNKLLEEKEASLSQRSLNTTPLTSQIPGL